MTRHFKPDTVQMSLGQHYIDAATVNRSVHVELKKVLNWESVAKLLLEIYGYKKHVVTDEAGMILAVHMRPANVHDSKGLVPWIKKVRPLHRQEVLADKGYKSKANDEFMAPCGSRSRIMYKGYRNRPINAARSAENREISRKYWLVERTLGNLKRWFDSGITQLKGLHKVHAAHVMEMIARNLKRLPKHCCVNGLKSEDKRRFLPPQRAASGSGDGEITLQNFRKNQFCPLKYPSPKSDRPVSTVSLG